MSTQIPQVEESTKFNFFTSIWIVPFIAMIIAGWLAYQYYSELGPEIEIIFPSNEGLKEGQSQIKYKDVPVGTITKIKLEKDGHGVVVVARMEKGAEPYLNDNTKFWIVKPELGVSGISGLDTLISGNYIGLYARKGGTAQRKFIGLDRPYHSEKKGSYYILKSQKGNSSVKAGTPIYLKNLKAGRVEYVMMGLNDIFVDVIIFIEKEFVPYVHTDSKFWVRSTLDAELMDGSLDINVAPFSDLLQGAIEFSTSGREENITVPDSFTFILYNNRYSVNTKKIGHTKKEIEIFEMDTKEPIAKLKIGSPVKFNEFKIGNVIEIALSYDKKSHRMNGKVLMEIDTSVFDDPSDLNDTGKENFYQAVVEGLRAQIDSIDPITGRQYVNLRFIGQDGNKSIQKSGHFACIPSIPAQRNDIMSSLNNILAKINDLPLEDLVASIHKVVEETSEPVANANEVFKDLKETVENLKKLTSRKSFERMPDEIDKTLKQLTRTLKTTQNVVKGYGNNSLLSRQITETLKIITQTSREMQEFLKMLNRKPNSLIFGDK